MTRDVMQDGELGSRVFVYLDESGTNPDSPRILVGAAATLLNETLASQIDHLQRQVAATEHFWQGDEAKRIAFETKGFHYNDDNETVRSFFVNALPALPFRAHVIHSRRRLQLGDDDFQTVALFMLLTNTMRRYASLPMTYIFEQDSNKNGLYGKVLSHAAEVAGHDDVEGYIGAKPMPGLSVVDYVLNIVASRLDPDSAPHRSARFLTLGPKIAHMLDLDTHTHRSRAHGNLFA